MVDSSDNEVFGLIDEDYLEDILDESDGIIPLPDQKHWLEVGDVNLATRVLNVSLYQYDDPSEAIQVCVCDSCGSLCEHESFNYGKSMCPECISIYEIPSGELYETCDYCGIKLSDHEADSGVLCINCQIQGEEKGSTYG